MSRPLGAQKGVAVAVGTAVARCPRRGGVRALRYHAGTNLVLLDPDVRKAFRNERAVDDALRFVIELRKVESYKQA